jgi:hypothetical protein
MRHPMHLGTAETAMERFHLVAENIEGPLVLLPQAARAPRNDIAECHFVLLLASEFRMM